MDFRISTVVAAFGMVCLLGCTHGFAQNAYITSDLANAVSVIDTTTNKVISTIPDSLFPFGVVVTPDARKVYVTNDGSQNVSVIDTTSNTIITTISLPNAVTPYGVVITLGLHSAISLMRPIVGSGSRETAQLVATTLFAIVQTQ
jgi:YVTN family beta-propeller protein